VRNGARWGTAAFLVVGPGTVAGLVPWLLTSWQGHGPVPGGVPAMLLGGLMIAAGVAVIVDAFVRFALEGRGTPVPMAPPKELVVGGVYRHVRNPMYLALGSLVAGQALLLGRPVLWAYLGVLTLVSVAFVHIYEEPHLTAVFGRRYAEYRRNVPGWLPRMRPWRQ
jgi:protein-S-isoprenylcysteine O-methyltransferase Ste14